jgi:molybdopterin molybdotransferase
MNMMPYDKTIERTRVLLPSDAQTHNFQVIMTDYQHALDLVLQHTYQMNVETLPLHEAIGRFLAVPIVADTNMPRFDSSAVDGYGVIAADIAQASADNAVKLRFCGSISAGQASSMELVRGSAIKIMTGSAIPPTVQAVVMQEFARESDDSVLIYSPAALGENIRPRAAEFRAGQTLFAKSTAITVPVIGLLAALGLTEIKVYSLPKVFLVATGSELAQPGQPLSLSHIYDCNTPALTSALNCLRVDTVAAIHCPDDPDKMTSVMESALSVSDVVIATGGMSVGDKDYFSRVCDALKVKQIFHRIAIKPGKPTYFGIFRHPHRSNHTLVFGLPGNPVGALLSFERFVRPAILKLCGCQDSHPVRLSATLGHQITKKPGRLEFVPGQLQFKENSLTVTPSPKRQSHMLSSLATADCIIHFPTHLSQLDPGDTVQVELLNWYL